MRIKNIISLCLLLAVSGLAQDINLSNRVATITTLDGKTFEKVSLVRGDLDGIIWRIDASGGRICYTNISPEFLATLGIDGSRIETAAARAAHRKVVSKFTPLTPEEVAAAQRAAEQRAKGEAELAINMQKAAELEAMVSLKLKIAAARDQIRRSEVAVHDANMANLYNDSAPTYYVKESARYQVEQAEAQLAAMQAQFDAKWNSRR